MGYWTTSGLWTAKMADEIWIGDEGKTCFKTMMDTRSLGPVRVARAPVSDQEGPSRMESEEQPFPADASHVLIDEDDFIWFIGSEAEIEALYERAARVIMVRGTKAEGL
jgi:hypothetical protein